MQYENTFKQIDQILWKEQGCGSELDYLEQKSWMLFLKYLDDFETEKEDEAELNGTEYKRLVTGFYRWSQWATPKKRNPETGKLELDTINAMTGDDLVEFVDQKLFPYLKEFKNSAAETDTLEYKIGEIFSELHNKIRSGFNMREIINKIDTLRFQSDADKHEMTVLYESNIQRMGNAGRNGGEYYTPRPLIRTIVKVVDPKVGETVYDPACGSAGFLCEAFLYMYEKAKNMGTEAYETLQKKTFFGREKKGLPYIIATMNMIFHGVSAPNITHGNTLAQNVMSIQESERKNVILANPPFGGNERGEVLQNFEIRTSETAYMFMQHFIKMLKVGGRAGIVIKNTFLSNGDASGVRKMLLESCNLHTILDLPSGVFTGAGVKTVVLFFTKGQPTEKVWYYQVDKHFTKTQPLTEADMEEFVRLQETKEESEHSWSISVDALGDDCDLSVKNPNKVEVVDERTPEEIYHELTLVIEKIQNKKNELKLTLKEWFGNSKKDGWKYMKLGDVATFINGDRGVNYPSKKDFITSGVPFVNAGNLCNSVIDTTALNYVSESKYNSLSQGKFIEGDILFCLRGTLGKHAIVQNGLYGAIASSLVIIRVQDSCLNRYVSYYLESKQPTIEKMNNGAAQPNIPAKAMKNFEIPIPSISEQQRIITYLDKTFSEIDSLINKAQSLFSESDALKQALLRQVFE